MKRTSVIKELNLSNVANAFNLSGIRSPVRNSFIIVFEIVPNVTVCCMKILVLENFQGYICFFQWQIAH